MTTFSCIWGFLSAFFLLSPAWSAVDLEAVHEVRSVGDFEDLIRKEGDVTVFFYAPWCGHCVDAKPKFAEAAQKLKAEEHQVTMAALNCEDDATKEVCSKHYVYGFPTVVYFKKGEYHAPMKAGQNIKRDVSAFLSFAKNPGPAKAAPRPIEFNTPSADGSATNERPTFRVHGEL